MPKCCGNIKTDTGNIGLSRRSFFKVKTFRKDTSIFFSDFDFWYPYHYNVEMCVMRNTGTVVKSRTAADQEEKILADENKDITSAQQGGGDRHEPTTDEIIAGVQAALAKSVQQSSDEDTKEEKPEAAEDSEVKEPAAAEKSVTAELPDVEKIISEAIAPADVEEVLSKEQEEQKETSANADAEDVSENMKESTTAEEEVPTAGAEAKETAEAAEAEEAAPAAAADAAPSGNTELIMDLKEKLEEAVKEDQLAKQEAAKEAARQAKAKKIEKRNKAILRRRILLGGIAAVVLAIVLIIVHLFRAGTWEDRAEVNTLTLNADGSIVYEEILNIEDTSKKELKSYVEEQIASYNDAAGENKITLERFASSKDGYYVRMTYADSAAYADFTGYWITTGSVQSSINAGITFPETMVAVEDGEKGDSVTAEDVQKETDLKLLTIQENTTVVVPGVVQYVTDESTTIDSDDTVTITAVEDDEDAAALTYIVYTADNSDSASEDDAAEEE